MKSQTEKQLPINIGCYNKLPTFSPTPSGQLMQLNQACHNTIVTLACLLGLLLSTSAIASIDVQCEQVTNSFIQQMNAENLVHQKPTKQARIKEIALGLCTKTEKLVQEQHTADKEKALKNWFFESHPEKAGNRRLKSKR